MYKFYLCNLEILMVDLQIWTVCRALIGLIEIVRLNDKFVSSVMNI